MQQKGCRLRMGMVSSGGNGRLNTHSFLVFVLFIHLVLVSFWGESSLSASLLSSSSPCNQLVIIINYTLPLVPLYFACPNWCMSGAIKSVRQRESPSIIAKARKRPRRAMAETACDLSVPVSRCQSRVGMVVVRGRREWILLKGRGYVGRKRKILG